MSSKFKWTEEKIQYLKVNYHKKPPSEIREYLECCATTVWKKAKKLGLSPFILQKKVCSIDKCDNEIGPIAKLCVYHRHKQYKSDSEVWKNYLKYARFQRFKTNARYSALKGECKRRNIDLIISLEEYQALWKSSNGQCSYCKSEIKQAGACLDRIDNSIGYSIENVIVCCVYCNRLRGNILSYEETKLVINFIQKLRRVSNIWEDAPKAGIKLR